MPDTVAAAALEREWTFYLHYPVFGQKYSTKAYQGVGTVATVPDFWKYFEHIPRPSAVFTDHQGKRGKVDGKVLEAFGIFRHGVQPEWEDPVNQRGGHWECRKRFELGVLDQIWYDVVLGIVGETMETGRVITGARVVDKSKHRHPEYRLEVWTESPDTGVNHDIRLRLESLLGDNNPGEFAWKQHAEAISAWKA